MFGGEGIGFAGDRVREVPVANQLGELLNDHLAAGKNPEDGDEEEQVAGEAAKHGADGG